VRDADGIADRRRPRRVGHKGADLIAPGNTLASFDAALEAGVDMIEFDVLPQNPPPKGAPPDAGSGPLRLVHDHRHLRETPDAPTLAEGLAHFASDAFAGVELDVDLKLPGYEREVVDALREHALVERCLISSQFLSSIDLIRGELAPEARLGWSVPQFRRDWSKHPLLRYPFLPVALAYRTRLPAKAASGLRAGRFDALMSHFRLITPRLVHAVQDAGGELFAWTVDEPDQIARLEALGVDGIISNDPRLFR
jgi:glycerophosphoryl diester phosphodiesterase